IVNKAEDSYCKHTINNELKKTDIQYPDAKDLDVFLNSSGIKLKYNSVYLKDITLDSSVIHVPTDVYNGGSKWDLQTGQVDLYDARSRSWFIQGSTSPKDIVIILDASGSMRGVPMSLAKLSAKALIDTFEDNDYFNVIWFNEITGLLICKEFKDQLIQATKKNKQAAKKIIEDDPDDIQGKNMAHWEKGVRTAFDLLRNTRKTGSTSNCQQAIMIFSDGTTNNLKEFFNTNNPKAMIRVFTYPVGPPAERTTAMLQMSRQNRGYFKRIQSVGAVRSVSESYIHVLSRPMARAPKENVTKSTVWTGAYLDALGLGMMVTGTLPVFYRPTTENNNCSKAQKKVYDHLIGVVGTDVPLKNLNEFFLQPLIGDSGYGFVVNNNGLVAFHPRLKTVYGYLPDAPGVDLMDAEFPLVKENLIKLRSSIINQTFLSSPSKPVEDAFEVDDVSRDEIRVVKRKLHFYVDSLQQTPFSFGIATSGVGFKYKMKSDILLGEIAKELNSSNLSLEKWPYCKGTYFAANIVDYLKTMDLSSRPSECEFGQDDMLTGLAVDLKATSNIPNAWTVDESMKTVFVRTHYGVTRKKLCTSCSGDDDYEPNQSDIGRVASDGDLQSVLYTSPYNADMIYHNNNDNSSLNNGNSDCNGITNSMNDNDNSSLNNCNNNCNGITNSMNDNDNSSLNNGNSDCNGITNSMNDNDNSSLNNGNSDDNCNGITNSMNDNDNSSLNNGNSDCNGITNSMNDNDNSSLNNGNSDCNGITNSMNDNDNSSLNNGNSDDNCNGITNSMNDNDNSSLNNGNSDCNGITNSMNDNDNSSLNNGNSDDNCNGITNSMKDNDNSSLNNGNSNDNNNCNGITNSMNDNDNSSLNNGNSNDNNNCNGITNSMNDNDNSSLNNGNSNDNINCNGITNSMNDNSNTNNGNSNDNCITNSMNDNSNTNNGRRERNSSTVIALQKVLLSNLTVVAVTGYEMHSSSFAKLVVGKTKKCSSNKCADVNCDRAGKHSHEGLYCYLLDENGFVVSSNNDDKSSGMFFGKVDNTVMHSLIQHDDNYTTGFYHKVVFTDFQAVCEKKTGFPSAGTSLLGPLFTVSSYIDWWTTKAC
ncbi:hypothetical protein QZH41_020241, partial [Actinostola sp. cb2023]